MAKLKISFSWRDDLVVDDMDPDTWPMIRGYMRGRAANPENGEDNNVRISPYIQPTTEDDDD